MQKSSCRILLLIACIALAAPAMAQTLVINTDERFPVSSEQGDGFLDIIVTEAFARIGVTISIVHLPSERALLNADQGVDDGLFDRIAGIDQDYPHLVMVPEKVNEFEFCAFTSDPDMALAGWEDLKPYNVGMVRGWKMVENNMPQVTSLVSVREDFMLFDLLLNGRADVVILGRLSGMMLAKERGLTGIHVVEPPLAVTDMYVYLHERHAALVPELARAIRELKDEGFYDQTVARVLGEAGIP